MKKIKKNVFRLFRVQACKATNHYQTSHKFMASIFIRYARSELRLSCQFVYIVCNCNSRWLSALFFFFFPLSMSETLSYLPNMARFSLKKPNKILCRKTITAIPKTRIIVVCVDAHSSEVTDLICSFVAPSHVQTLLDLSCSISSSLSHC